MEDIKNSKNYYMTPLKHQMNAPSRDELDQMISTLWRDMTDTSTQIINEHVSRIQQKLEKYFDISEKPVKCTDASKVSSSSTTSTSFLTSTDTTNNDIHNTATTTGTISTISPLIHLLPRYEFF